MAKPAKKNNHQVTRSLLAFWKTDRNGKPVIWSFDALKQEKRFSQGEAASFAIVEYLYAPLQENGDRDDDLENEFAFDEDSLARLLRAANISSARKPTYRDLRRAVRSCVSLGFRSAYYTFNAMALLHANGIDTQHLHGRALDLMKHTLRTKYAQFSSWRFVIVTGLAEDLLVNEQPFRDWTTHKEPQQFITMALGPRAMLFGSPAPDGRFGVAWNDRDQAQVNVRNHNHFTIETTRQFIFAASEEQLDSVQPLLSPELLTQRMRSDRVIVGRGAIV